MNERRRKSTRRKEKKRQQTEASCLHISFAFSTRYTTITDDQTTILDQFTCNITKNIRVSIMFYVYTLMNRLS